ncbi:MAG: gliding motility lipoprotein GldD [Bacteroidota bacterium]|nr:gliding motility lipoprotein GldD [Bacteroidota bacterium]
MRISIVVVLFFFGVACSDNYTPKPRAFFKFDLPAKEYNKIVVECNFSFEKPIYSILKKINQDCFYNLNFFDYNGILHITYLPLKDNLLEHIEESRTLAYKHDIMANAISESVYINDEYKVYGLLYDYEGSTATATQFYLTDSINHFFRAALYFNTEVTDSLLPINNFIKDDIKHIIETFKWEKQQEFTE